MTQQLYAQVHATLRSRIVHGEWGVGFRLPSQQKLTEEFSVSTITIKRALDMLRDEGLVTRRPRIGTVVVSQAPRNSHASQRQPLVGYVVPDFSDAFGTQILGGLVAAARGHAHVLIGVSHGDSAVEEELIEQQLSQGVEGLILQPSSSQLFPPPVATLIGERFPLVIMDRKLQGMPVSSVASDNVEGGRLAAEHFFARGHTQLALVMSSNPVSTLNDRLNGIVNAHAAHHVRFNSDHVFDQLDSNVPGSGVTTDQDVQRLVEFLGERPQITGCIAAEYGLARLVLTAALRLGHSVPDDFSIVSFDAPYYFEDSAIPLTHVAQDQVAMGRQALALLQQQFASPGTVSQESLPVRIIQGGSTTAVTAGQ